MNFWISAIRIPPIWRHDFMMPLHLVYNR